VVVVFDPFADTVAMSGAHNYKSGRCVKIINFVQREEGSMTGRGFVLRATFGLLPDTKKVRQQIKLEILAVTVSTGKC
jgi:hypothetical protein